jgi:ubiquitin C-terminal hydrolase
VASYEAWNKHILRNESIICDLFHGQFKSKLICSVCDRVSVTFDPFNSVQVPIVSAKSIEMEGYLMTYKIDDEYQNFKFKFSINENDRVYQLR